MLYCVPCHLSGGTGPILSDKTSAKTVNTATLPCSVHVWALLGYFLTDPSTSLSNGKKTRSLATLGYRGTCGARLNKALTVFTFNRVGLSLWTRPVYYYYLYSEYMQKVWRWLSGRKQGKKKTFVTGAVSLTVMHHAVTKGTNSVQCCRAVVIAELDISKHDFCKTVLVETPLSAGSSANGICQAVWLC